VVHYAPIFTLDTTLALMLPFSCFEARTILKLSGPIVLAQLTQTLMYFVDTVMAGRADDAGLIAGLNADCGAVLWQ
jgi:Na+-driven multidrug efflux pump